MKLTKHLYWCGSRDRRSFILLSCPICLQGFCSSKAESVSLFWLFLSLRGILWLCAGVWESRRRKVRLLLCGTAPAWVCLLHMIHESVWERVSTHAAIAIDCVWDSHRESSRLVDHAIHSVLSTLSVSCNTPLIWFHEVSASCAGKSGISCETCFSNVSQTHRESTTKRPEQPTYLGEQFWKVWSVQRDKETAAGFAL